MGRQCSVCSLSQLGVIDAALRKRRSAASLAVEYGLSTDTVQRHARLHLGSFPEPSVVGPVHQGVVTDPLDELVKALRAKALAGDTGSAREYRLVLLAQERRSAAAAPQVDLAATSEWLDLRTALLAALEPFPEARIAVSEALEHR
jgi:hypothetical protein